MRRHVLLLGLPGAGKTAAGREAAHLLDVPFRDVDEEVERTSGRSVNEIFRVLGEPRFRQLEREACRRLLSDARSVIAPGGGWAAQPGNLEIANKEILIYLYVSPEVASRRLEGDTPRPLLGETDRLAAIQELYRRRRAFYESAGWRIDTDALDPSGVAAAVASLARRVAGW